MYRILADDVLIYDSTLEDYKLGKGSITLEVNKSGSFVFSVYPDHFFYDRFVKRKTVITVYKSGRIVFRGRILNDVTDYWNIKTITCEGELGFLLDSVIRPFSYTGAPAGLFRQFIEAHNSQVDDFKKFNVGTCTVVDGNSYINRSSTDYGLTLNTLQGSLTESALGGYFYITHGDDGTDPTPTLHYLEDFDHVSAQDIEFGVNLKDYTKTVKAEDVVTAIIPLGAEVTNADVKTRLTIADVNGGADYVYSPEGVEAYGWIFASVTWDDVTLASNLKAKAEAYLQDIIKQSMTIELNAIDLHALDRSVESFRVCDYVRVVSAPHNIDAQLLCNKQTMDLLNPGNDSIVLGYSSPTLSGVTKQLEASISTLGRDISSIKQSADTIEHRVEKQGESISTVTQTATDLSSRIESVAGDVTALEMSLGSIKLDVSNGSKSSTITLSIDGVDVATSGTISFTGDVVFASDLTDGETEISGDNILTGEILADYIRLYSAMAVYKSKSGSVGGYLGYVEGEDTDGDVTKGIGMSYEEDSADGGGYVMATSGGARMGYSGGELLGCSESNIFASQEVSVSSDERRKNSIVYDLPESYAKLYKALKPCRFKYNNGTSDRYHTGLIAQELEQAILDGGLTTKDLAALVKDEEGVYAIRYGELIALNTAFIQKLMGKVEALEAELATLKGGV